MSLKVSRRTLIKAAGLVSMSSIGTYAIPLLAKSPEDHFLVVCSMPGGLDATMGLDPQYPAKNIDGTDLFVDFRADEIFQVGNLKLGPACLELAPYYGDICVVNGVSALRDAGHEANMAHALTGNMGGELSHYAIQFANFFRPSPLGVLTNTPLIMRKQTAPIADLQSVGLKLGSANPKLSVSGLANLLNSKLKVAAEQLEGSEKETLEIFSQFKNKNNIADICFTALAASFASGLSYAGALDMTRFISSLNLDSHSNHEKTHLQSQKSAWSHVAKLFQVFKATPYQGKSLFDHTSFVVLTEFSRIPFLNSSKGKDHNPFTNSFLLAGKGIKGNQVVGESKIWSRKETPDKVSLHTAMPINMRTGKIETSINANSDLIVPENFARSLYDLFKINSVPKQFTEVKPIPNLFKV